MEYPRKVDDVLSARWVIPIVPDGVYLENHSVVIHEGTNLAEIGKIQGLNIILRQDLGYPSHWRSETEIY